MRLILWCLLFFSSVAYANRISIDVEPVKPVLNEPFVATVLIETTDSQRPSFSFNPIGIEVIDRREEGISTQTTIINGQISMKRIYQIAYTLTATRVGTVRLTDVKATIGNKTIQGDPVTIDIISERAAPRMFFVRAEPSKNEVYMGEGLNVEYYLYFRVPVVNLEILDFPKLNGFIKRFHMTNDHHETVEVDGNLYRRRKAYSARVYPERIGELYIDPIRLNVHYSDQSSGSLSAFGFNSRQQSRSIFSENVIVKVNPLPLENLPANFIGLVGEHSFNLEIKRNRFLKNEVVEVILEIEGDGALENINPPDLLTNQAFEKFDVKQEFREISPSLAKKIFNYTYIAREAVQLPRSSLELSFFSTSENRYKNVQLELPELVVADTDSSAGNPRQPTINPKVDAVTPKQYDLKLLSPIFSSVHSSGILSKIRTQNIILILILLLFAVWLSSFVGVYKYKADAEFKRQVKEIKHKGLSYQRLFGIFDYCIDLLKTNDLRDSILQSDLTNESKDYFIKLLNQIESAEFHNSQNKINPKFEKNHYDNLFKLKQKKMV